MVAVAGNLAAQVAVLAAILVQVGLEPQVKAITVDLQHLRATVAVEVLAQQAETARVVAVEPVEPEPQTALQEVASLMQGVEAAVLLAGLLVLAVQAVVEQEQAINLLQRLELLTQDRAVVAADITLVLVPELVAMADRG